MQESEPNRKGDERAGSASSPFQLRGNFVTAMVLRLIEPDHPGFLDLLSERIGQAPNFYRNAPVVLDLRDLATGDHTVNLPILLTQLRGVGMVPVGVQNGNQAQHDMAIAAGLALMPQGRSGALEDPRVAPSSSSPLSPSEAIGSRAEETTGAGEPEETGETGETMAEEPLPVPPPPPPARRPSRLITEPVRSGQVVYAHDSDLIVMAAVSSGAELLADGHIHVYGPLRGRALAGVGGDTGARIFCRSLEAELVSVAGLYKLSDNYDPALWRHPVHISLSGSTLSMELLA
ncbi:MAG: septum site-determining protein MinC [Alphaproteobacteria bacterium]